MLSSDLPIKTSDDDILSRKTFAENLANAMIEYNRPEGFSIGIHGKWGSGKTSVINMTIENLQKIDSECQESKPIILRFNPWLCADPKQLIAQFFKQLSSLVKKEQPKLDLVCSFLDNYADAFEMLEAIPIAGKILSTIGKTVSNKAKNYNTAKNSDLQQIKDGIIEALLKEKVKIIITIDDIDRLSNVEIISVFQLVKSLADFPYTIYLLAFDRDVVIGALANVQQGDGAEYLEKIIQVPFELPVPNTESIYQMFFNKLDAIVNDIPEEKWDKEYWSDMFHYGIKNYLSSIRDVIRYVNAFSLKYTLLKTNIYAIDLIGLTCIQVFEPRIYSVLSLYKEQLCGSLGYYSGAGYDHDIKKIEDAYNQIISAIPEKRQKNVSSILFMLFPKLRAAKHNMEVYMYTRNFNHYETLRNGSICNSTCFQRYFALSLEEDAIPLMSIEHLLFDTAKPELVTGIEQINSSNKINRFLEHLCATFESLKGQYKYANRATILYEVITQYWHTLENNEASHFLAIPFEWRLIYCTRALLQVINDRERLDIIKSVFNNQEIPLSTLVSQLRYFEEQHGRFTDKKDGSEVKLLKYEEMLDLERVFTYRVKSEAEHRSLLDDESALHTMWLWDQIEEEDISEKYIGELIYSDLNLVKLISCSVRRGKGSGRGVFDIWCNGNKNIAKYVDLDIAYKRLLDFVKTNDFNILDLNIRQNIAAFLIFYEKPDEDTLQGGVVISAIEKRLNEISS